MLDLEAYKKEKKRVAAPEEWKKTPGRRQPFRAQRNNIMFSITSKGGNVNGR